MRFESNRRRSVLSILIFTVLVAPLLSTAIEAASPDSAPPLPAPTGTVVTVSTEPELQAAVRNLSSNTTILVAAGTYYLSSTLYIGGPLTNIAVRGATGKRDDVVFVGPGMTNGNFGNVPYGIWTGDGVQGILIANLTIRDFYYHPLILNAGTTAPHIYNVRLADGGEQLLKSNPDYSGNGNNNGIVEYSVFEYTDTSRDWYTNGVDVHAGASWVIRHNLFRNIRAPFGQLAGPSILIWRGARDTVVDGNTFVNCQREIAFGLEDTTPNEHTGGVIRNNFIYRDSWVSGDVGINLSDAPSAQVLHNSIVISGTYPNAIEYRFPNTTNVFIANNLADGAIVSRDGASALLANNSTAATYSLFVNPAAGDLHLAASATGAIDKAIPVDNAATDWDGDPRLSAPDLGADETNVSTSVAGGTASSSPDGTVVPTSANQIVDGTGAVWTIGSGLAILRNGVSAAGGLGSRILWQSSTIYVLGNDSNWWQWLGSAWSNVGNAAPSGAGTAAAPNGTVVPTSASQIVDNTGAVWTIGSGLAILRNGVSAAGGLGSQILWQSGTIYVLGTDNHWWQWIGAGWINIGSTAPGVSGTTGSANGTLVPLNATQITDASGGIWTIGAGQIILRSGVPAAGGLGSQILWQNSSIHVLGIDSNWWQWTGSNWVNIGPTQP